MSIDWKTLREVGMPVATLFLGAWVARWFEKRPSLTSYFGHVSAFKHTPPNGASLNVFTHTVVLRNSGRKSATNVRLNHIVLPDFEIYPPIEHRIVDLADGSREILIPTMVPGEQITISYLYFPPVTYSSINAGIKSDEGFAKPVSVLLQRQYSTWINILAALLLLVGVASTVYVLVLAFRRLVP